MKTGRGGGRKKKEEKNIGGREGKRRGRKRGEEGEEKWDATNILNLLLVAVYSKNMKPRKHGSGKKYGKGQET